MLKKYIHVRARIAIIEDGKILLIPHIFSDGTINWHIPGGRVNFGETLREAAERELTEETGYIGKAGDVVYTHDVIQPERDYHGISITFLGKIMGGELRAEEHPVYGRKEAQWLSADDLLDKSYNTPEIINNLLGIET